MNKKKWMRVAGIMMISAGVSTLVSNFVWHRIVKKQDEDWQNHAVAIYKFCRERMDEQQTIIDDLQKENQTLKEALEGKEVEA